jgi:tRNA threonylcarbamoyladenosine biosynthesis protein TsaB
VLTLAIDTATARVGVAVGSDGRVLAELTVDGARRHAEELVPAIAEVAREAGVGLDRLQFVSVGLGPGLFTGLRVGVTTARTLGQVLGIPVVGIPSLDLVAHPWRHTDRRIVALIDARRGEVFAARWTLVGDRLERHGDYTVEAPGAIAAELTATGVPVRLVGDGALEYEAVFDPLPEVELLGVAAAYPDVGALVELATARYERGEHHHPEHIQPIYLRRSDAEINWGRT